MADASETNRQENQGRKSGTKKITDKIVLITESFIIQDLVKQYFADVVVVTRTMLLTPRWMDVRDQSLRSAAAVWIEIVQGRTATGTRNDRKIVERNMDFVRDPGVRHVALFALADPMHGRWQKLRK